jgi:hypothetical protein
MEVVMFLVKINQNMKKQFLATMKTVIAVQKENTRLESETKVVGASGLNIGCTD